MNGADGNVKDVSFIAKFRCKINMINWFFQRIDAIAQIIVKSNDLINSENIMQIIR